MSQLTTHVLDTALGRPAAGVAVVLEQQGDDGWSSLATAGTDSDGRVASLGPDALVPGRYRLTFATADYFEASGQAGFFPEVSVVFEVGGSGHHHVPLLLSPFGYSTYRGS